MYERFVVWSPGSAAAMALASRTQAEQYARLWRDTFLLGCGDWRVCPVGNAPAATPSRPDASACGAAAARPQGILATDDRPAVAHEDLPRLLAAKDALIDELQRRLNEYVLNAAREAVAHDGRIAELEAQVATLRRRARELRTAS